MHLQTHSVVICDTQPIAIEGLRSLLEHTPDLRLVAEESSLSEGTEAVRSLRPALTLVDRAFGPHAVIDWIGALRSKPFGPRVVVWGMQIAENEALRFLHAGASGVIRKTAPLADVVRCLRTVAEGGNWMENAAIPAAVPGRIRHSPLTAREAQVMELVERGLKNREIAHELGIEVGTVKIHLKHMFEKTGIHGRYGLALTGLREKGLALLPQAQRQPPANQMLS